MIKSTFTLLYILLITTPQFYQGCNIGCLKCNTQNSQAECEICDETNYFFLRNGTCFKNFDNFCTKYSSNGNCLQCINKRAPNTNNLLQCKKLEKNQQIQFCYEHFAQNLCASCNSGKFVNAQGQCQNIDTNINQCKIYDSANTCKQCQNSFHLSIDKKQCLKSKLNKKCAVQQNLQCKKCKNHYFKLDQTSYDTLDNSFLEFYQTQNFYYQQSCQEILQKIENCESYDANQQCVLCQVGFYLQLDPITECKSVNDDQSEFLIENCSQLQTKDTCYRCDNNYHPSIDRKQCIFISQQPDCKTYSNILNGSQPFCEECNEEYFLRENNTCMIRSNYPIESCQQYSEFQDQCLNCGENQLSDTKDFCIKITENCLEYESKQLDLSISKCNACQNPFVIQNNICVEGNVQNCKAYDQVNFQCNECQNQFYLTINDQQQQECQLQQEVDNCDQYYSTLQQIEQQSCQFCQSGFLLQNIENQCIEMSTPNCDEENQNGDCFECEEGFEKIIENGNIKCIEKLNMELDQQCQQKENFLNFNGWEDYDNQHCQTCNENYIPRYILGQCVADQIAIQRENFIQGCISFSEEMQCQLCEDQKVLYQNQCLQECPEGTVLHDNYIDLKIINQERNFIIKKNQCIEKIYYEDEYLQNCDIRTRRAYTLLDIVNREYCLKCDQNSIPTIGHSFYRINLINSQFNDTNNFDEFHPLIKCQQQEPLFQQIENCEYYGEKNEFDSNLVCKKCKNGFRENSNLQFEDQPIQQACENLQGNNCLSCKLGYYLKFFDSLGGNACYLPKDYYQDCSEQISECIDSVYQQIPGDLVGLISCQKCSNGKVPAVGVKQMVIQNSQFNLEISDYLFTHQSLPQTNTMIECIGIDQIETTYNIPQGQLNESNPNGFVNCAVFGISRAYPDQTDNQIHCLACKPGYYTPDKPFRSDVCQPIPNCEVAGNKVNTCEKLFNGFYWGVEEQFYELPNKIYQSSELDQNCSISYQDRGCLICKKGYELDESLQCIQVVNQNCLESNYYMPTLYLERNQINLLTFLQTSNLGFGCYQCNQGFVAFNDGFRKQCINDDQYRLNNRFNPLVDQGVQEIVFVQDCIQYQLQDNIQSQLLRGNNCIKCEAGRNLNTNSNECEPLGNSIDFCQYYIDNECTQCQQGQYYLQNGQCFESNEIENCIEYLDQNTCLKCQDQQNQQYELINNQCSPKFVCNESFITTDYMSVQNNFFNGIKCDNEFQNLNVQKLQAQNSQLEIIQCQDGYKVDNKSQQYCLAHNLIANCHQYDQNLQRHLVFDLNPQCIKCDQLYYLQSNQCLERQNTQNCSQFEQQLDQCEICEDQYYLNNGNCLPVDDNNCQKFKQNENKCIKCKEDYILNDQENCELYHFLIDNCDLYSSFGRYCQKCKDDFYLSDDNLNCIQRQNYQIDFCNVYSLKSDNCQSCQNGYYLQDSQIQCTQIQTFVQNCERPLTLNKCHECEIGFILNDDQTQCNEVQNPLQNCQRYIDENNCYQCKDEAELYEGQCFIPDQNNCLKYQLDQCEVCADGYSYDFSSNICFEDNYEAFCEQCSNKQTLQCSQHCSEVENCEKMTWYGRCEQCESNYILSYDQSRCYQNDYDDGCEVLVETQPFCRTCQQGFKEFLENGFTYCFRNKDSNCIQRDQQGNCQLCKPGSYQTTEGLCKSNKQIKNNSTQKNSSSNQRRKRKQNKRGNKSRSKSNSSSDQSSSDDQKNKKGNMKRQSSQVNSESSESKQIRKRNKK